MKRTYCLIRNTSGCTYWSYRLSCSRCAELDSHQKALEKHGTIYVNRNYGYFPESNIDEIIAELVQEEFPDERDIDFL